MHDGGTQWRNVKSNLEAAAECALDLARRAGADGVRVEIDHVESRTATVRNRVPAERSLRLSSAVSLVVYRNGRRGATTSSDLSADGLAGAVAAAIDIASVTDADAAAGLAQADLLATDFIDLDLYHPLDLSLDDILEDARCAEEAAFSTSPAIVTTNGASVGTSAGLSVRTGSRRRSLLRVAAVPRAMWLTVPRRHSARTSLPATRSGRPGRRTSRLRWQQVRKRSTEPAPRWLRRRTSVSRRSVVPELPRRW